MPEIKIYPLNITIPLRKGETVKDALYRAGIDMDTPCNGDGLCGKCLVRVGSPMDAAPTPHRDIDEDQVGAGIRLACRLVPHVDMEVHLIADYSHDDHRILEGTRDADFFTEDDSSGGAHDEKRHYRMSDTAVRHNPAVKLADEGGCISLAYDGEAPETLDPWPSDACPKGLAIDLGTTTLVVSLVDLSTGRELTTTSGLNPQISFGHDVVRRIQHGSSHKGLDELSTTVREALNRLIEECCIDSHAEPMEILDVVIGGNPAMMELAAGIDPSPLGEVPFTVDLEGGRKYPATFFGLDVHPAASVYVPPIVHAYVGADISAGLLVCRNFFNENGSMLYVDIGTNGEMGLSADGRWLLTSTAAGPAFEGMGISCGMRARIGAVEAATTIGRSLKFHTIGDAPPAGICGSGIIDLTAALFRLGVIEASGRMRRPDESGDLPGMIAYRLELHDEKPAFHVGGDVWFTQEDVRQVQLAKSAIRAAIDILFDETGLTPETLDRIVLAGGFGYSLRPKNLEAIGLLPPGTADKVYFAGNTCRIGCVRMLRNIANRRFLEERIGRVQHLPIETRPDFMDRYVESMSLPEPQPDTDG